MPYKDKERTITARREAYAQATKFLNDLRESTPCMDCGNCFEYFIMEFDHRESANKIHNVASLRSSGPRGKRLFNEIAKCDIVCANCHKRRTWERGQQNKRRAAHPMVGEVS